MTRFRQALTSFSGRRFARSVILLVVLLATVPLIRQNVAYMTDGLSGVISGDSHGGDFIAFYAAGRLFREHQDASPYDLDRLRESEFQANPHLREDPDWTGGGVNPFRNPPFYLPVVASLAAYPLATGFLLSFLASALLIGGVLTLTAQWASRRSVPMTALVWVALCTAYYDVWHGLIYGQLPAYIVAMAVTVGLILLQANQKVWAGIAFSVLLLKVQYIPALGFFFVALGLWRSVLGFALGSAGLVAVSVGLVGLNGALRYVETVVRLSLAPRGWYAANYESMINWRGLLERALVPEHPQWVLPILAFLTVATLALAAWTWRSSDTSQPWRRDAKFALLPLTMLLSSPHVHVQDMVLMLPALALVVSYLWHAEAPILHAAATGAGLVALFWFLPLQDSVSPRFHLSAFLVAVLFLLLSGALLQGAGWRRRRTADSPLSPAPIDSPPATPV